MSQRFRVDRDIFENVPFFGKTRYAMSEETNVSSRAVG